VCKEALSPPRVFLSLYHTPSLQSVERQLHWDENEPMDVALGRALFRLLLKMYFSPSLSGNGFFCLFDATPSHAGGEKRETPELPLFCF